MNSSRWEDLRRTARQIENELDSKLVTYSRLGASFSNVSGTGTLELGYGNPHDAFKTITLEIERLLDRLTQVNEELSGCLKGLSSAGVGGAAFFHTLQRHREILQDYNQEFRKTKANILAAKEREDLIGSVHRDIAEHMVSSRTHLLCAEQTSLASSERLVDEQLATAAGVRASMAEQRGILYSTGTRVIDMASRLPGINSVIARINLRTRRDAIIVAVVIALCIIGLIYYSFR